MVVALFLATVAFAAPKFPPLTGRVVDNAELLSPDVEARLTDRLAALEQQTGHQLVVATLPDLQGLEIEDYGYQLLRSWGVGREKEDDGVILIVAPSERKVRVEVGYGLEPVLTDALSSVIVQTAIVPAFKAGRMEDGIVAGAEALAGQLALPDDQARAVVADAEKRQSARNDGGSGVPIIFVVIIILWVISGIMRLIGGRRGASGLWWLLPLLLDNASRGGRGGWSGGGGGWGGGGGGFSGGGGSGGGGGASGSW